MRHILAVFAITSLTACSSATLATREDLQSAISQYPMEIKKATDSFVAATETEIVTQRKMDWSRFVTRDSIELKKIPRDDVISRIFINYVCAGVGSFDPQIESLKYLSHRSELLTDSLKPSPDSLSGKVKALNFYLDGPDLKDLKAPTSAADQETLDKQKEKDSTVNKALRTCIDTVEADIAIIAPTDGKATEEGMEIIAALTTLKALYDAGEAALKATADVAIDAAQRRYFTELVTKTKSDAEKAVTVLTDKSVTQSWNRRRAAALIMPYYIYKASVAKVIAARNEAGNKSLGPTAVPALLQLSEGVNSSLAEYTAVSKASPKSFGEQLSTINNNLVKLAENDKITLTTVTSFFKDTAGHVKAAADAYGAIPTKAKEARDATEKAIAVLQQMNVKTLVKEVGLIAE
jgi:hypothetical protein